MVNRVQSLLNLGMFSNYRIHQVLQKYAPPYIKFVGQWVEGVDWEIDTSCDLYLLHISSPNPDSYRPFFWNRVDWWKKLTDDFYPKKKLLLAEYMSEGYPEWVTDKDIVQSYSCDTPDHPNLIKPPSPLAGRWIDESLFNPISGLKREPGRMVACSGQNWLELQKVSPALTLLGLGNNHKAKYRLRASDDNIWVSPFKADELNSVYSRSEVAVNMQNGGFESWAIEAMFCGCKAYYPDTEHYRVLFGDENIGFYDPNDIANSLDLNNDLTEEDIKFTRAKWSAKERVPAFWKEVRCRI